MKIHISHKEILSPSGCSNEIMKMTNAIIKPSDAIQSTNILVYVLLQAQVCGPEDEHQNIEMLRVLGGNLSQDGNLTSLASLIRAVSKVVHNASMKQDSIIVLKDDNVIVSTE